MSIAVNLDVTGGGGGDVSWTDSTGTALRRPDGSALPATSWGPDMRRVLALGTSITNKWLDTGASSWIRTSPGDSYLFWMLTALRAREAAIINKGVSGNTTTQMLARYDADVAANYADFDTLIIEPGPNDYHSSIPFATVTQNIATMVGAALTAGKFVVLLTPSTAETWTSAQSAVAQEVRQWIINTYRAAEAVRVVDVAALLADPLTGLPLSALYVPTSVEAQRLHPSLAGAQVIGRAIAEVATNAPAVAAYRPLGQRDHYELVPNPRLTGNNASTSRNFSAGSGGITVTGGPDSANIAVVVGSFASVTIAPVSNTGANLSSISGGSRLTIGAAGSDRSQVRMCIGSSDGLYGSMQYGRWDLTWAATTAGVVGDHRRLAASPLGILECITSGTTAGTAPTAPSAYGETVTDGSVVWVWKRLPAVGDIVVPEVEYEIEAQSGGMTMYAIGDLLRTPAALNAENWGRSEAAYYDIGATTPAGLPGLWMPRSGVLRGLPVTLRDPGVSLRHVYVGVFLNFASGATATVRIDRASLRRVG